jgi:hypothetical protein
MDFMEIDSNMYDSEKRRKITKSLAQLKFFQINNTKLSEIKQE